MMPWSIISTAAGTTPRAMISDTVAAQSLDVHEVEQHRADGGRERRQPHADARDDAERPLRADHDAAQVVAGGLGPLAPQALDGAVRQHDVERQHVRRRDAVRQAVRAAGVRVHVAADRRRLLRRRVGRVREPERAERGRRDRGWADPGSTQASRSSVRTSRMSCILAVTTTSASPTGVAAPARPVPLPARHDRQPVLGRDPDARDDVVGRTRERDERAPALDHGGVARVELEREGIGEHLVGPERGLERAACGLDVGHGGRVGAFRW